MPITEGQNRCESNSEEALIAYIKTVPELAAMQVVHYQDLTTKEGKQIGAQARSQGEWIRRTGIQRMSFTIQLQVIAADITKVEQELELVWGKIVGLVYSTQIEAQLTSPIIGCKCYPKSVKRGMDNKAFSGNKFIRAINFEAAMIEI